MCVCVCVCVCLHVGVFACIQVDSVSCRPADRAFSVAPSLRNFANLSKKLRRAFTLLYLRIMPSPASCRHAIVLPAPSCPLQHNCFSVHRTHCTGSQSLKWEWRVSKLRYVCILLQAQEYALVSRRGMQWLLNTGVPNAEVWPEQAAAFLKPILEEQRQIQQYEREIREREAEAARADLEAQARKEEEQREAIFAEFQVHASIRGWRATTATCPIPQGGFQGAAL